MADDRPKRPREAGPPIPPDRTEPAQAAPATPKAPSPRRPADGGSSKPSGDPETGAKPGERRGRRAARGALVAAGLAGGAVAGLAVARRLGRDVPPLYRSLRATPLEFPFRSHRVIWYTAGKEGAPPVVLLHGVHTAGSAWEMRELFEGLGPSHRVYAYDLLGYGASERPEIDYDAQLYVDLLREFMRREVRRPAHVVASSLSAAHALVLAGGEPELFASITVINPTGLLSRAEGQRTRGRLVEHALRTPWIGEALYNLLVSRPALRRSLGRLYGEGHPALVDQVAEHHYAAAHQPGARYAPAAYLGDALSRNTYMALRGLDIPLLAIWSSHGSYLNVDEEHAAFSGVAPQAEHTWIDSGFLPHEEAPEETVETIREWIARDEGPPPGGGGV